ncbi:MAG: hypothetical protein WD184_06140 [Acidimicrobiia bacterium]
MSLDDLARQAAEQARSDAATGGHLHPEAYRTRRQRRTQRRALLFSGAFVGAALVVAILVSPPEEDELAVPTTTIPGVATTLPSTTTTVTTTGPEPSIGPPPLGVGWEELDPGPIAGRYRMAVAWTDYGLFVFGGHDNYRQEDPSPVLYHQNAYLFDPVDGAWQSLAEVPQEVFEIAEPRAVAMESDVFVYGRPRAPNSGRAAIYDLEADAWVPVAPEFGDSLGPGVQVVWTGELLVATNIALAYDPVTGTTLTHLDDGMMATPADADAAVHSPQRAHWSGSEILVVGSGPVYAWVPGEEAEWRTLAQPPVPDRARDSVWTDQGLLVVNYQAAAAVLDRDTSVWSRPGDLPLRFYECLPEAVSAGGTPVVRMCSGIGIWDEVRSSWIPVPLDGGNSGELVGADDAIYTVGGDTFRRFEIERAADGSIEPPPTVPIGVAELDIPPGWELVSSFAPDQSPDGIIPDDETIGLVFLSPTATCSVTSTYASEGWSPEGFIEVGPGIIDSPGRPVLPATYYRGADHDGWAAAVPTSTSDVVFIHCQKGPDPSHFPGAVSDFHLGLRSALVEDVEIAPPSPEIIIGTGWEEIAGSPVAGRMRTAVVWTGSEIFVWGGHDGYSQETPNFARFHQDAYLFDPTTGVWRMASDPPDGLCPLTEATATWIGDAVLLRGAALVTPNCVSGAATYDPVADSWTVLEGEFFDRVPFRAEVVWIGRSLAAPVFGLAWVPDEDGGETIEIPIVPDAGSQVGSPSVFHQWGGERITAIGAGDLYWLVPGAETWESVASLGIGEAGRLSVLTEHGLFVVTRDGEVARVVDFADVHLGENLPLRLSECDAFLVAVGDLPVAQVGCSGMAIWDPVRSLWVPIPMDVLSGWSWQPTLIGTDNAIYSFGEKVLRYPIERLGDGSVANPPTIPVGVMQLDIPTGFWLRSTVGLTQTEWPDGSYGEVVAFAFEAPRGSCQLSARYGGPEITVEASVDVDGTEVPLPWFTFRRQEGESDTWVIVVGDGVDSIWINCDSEEDAQLLIDGFWLP